MSAWDDEPTIQDEITYQVTEYGIDVNEAIENVADARDMAWDAVFDAYHAEPEIGA
jgi:hypothetical protein